MDLVKESWKRAKLFIVIKIPNDNKNDGHLEAKNKKNS